MKKYKFLDGSEILVDNNTCRGCYLETSIKLPQEILPIWSNDFFVIRQDAEIPMPGFYIVSTRQHINTMADLPVDKAEELGAIINRLRFHMNSALGISRLHMILEERMIEPHLHIGDEVIVKVIKIDDKGRVNLTIKGVSDEEKAQFN